MLSSQSSNIKNRRSSSILSQKNNSNRSSMSISAINVQQLISINNNNNITSSITQNTYNNKKGQQTILEQNMQTIKKQLIQKYKVIKEHVKNKQLNWNQKQLTEVYHGISNVLKNIQKSIQLVAKIKSKNQINKNELIKNQIIKSQLYQNQLVKRQIQSKFNSSSKILKSQSQYNNNKQNFNINSFFINQNDNLAISQLSTKINQLQKAIEQQKQKHSQQIRLMIQNHQQQMMFFQQEQSHKLSQIKKQYQQQIQNILITHKKSEQEIKLQSNRKVQQQVKIKVDHFKLQQNAKYQQFKNSFQTKQNQYKITIKSLIQKLKISKLYAQQLNKQQQKNTYKTKIILQKFAKLQSQKGNNQNSQFFTILSNKIQNIISSNNLKDNKQIPKINHSQVAPQPVPYSTLAIQNMFIKSNNLVLQYENNPSDHSLQNLLQKLIYWGFFCQQNQQNVSSLFGIGKNRGVQQMVGISNAQTILSHTLYPLILQKIKITLSKYNQQNQEEQDDNQQQKNLSTNLLVLKNSGNGEKQITQFSTQNCHKIVNNLFPVKYRNIQSIEELEVSDSMICDDQIQDHKQIGIRDSQNFQNHSPITNYKGYQTQQQIEHSSSFDVDMF